MNLLWTALIILILVVSERSYADSASQNVSQTLKVKPNRCIALHEGQLCYQKLQFNWATPEEGNYCLYQQSEETAILCWQGSNMHHYIYKFESAQSELFSIRDEETKTVLAEVEVSVAWVYKRTKKVTTGWRLF